MAKIDPLFLAKAAKHHGHTGEYLEQSGCNNKFFHNSLTYIVSRLWNKLPALIKTSSKFSDFTRNLKAFDFSKLGPSCHCNSCI